MKAPELRPRPGRGVLEELIAGAIDLHAHGYPEFGLQHRARLDDVELLEAMRAAGLAGVVLKSHLWPTMDRAYYVQQRVPEVTVYPSITLNTVVGGVDPDVVAAAADLGARVVFFPTWTARNDRARQGISALVQRTLGSFAHDHRPGVDVVEGGRLRGEADAVLEVAADRGLLVATGHVSVEEGLQLCARANEKGVRTVFSHPTSRIIGARPEHLREAVAAGALIEFCVLHAFSLLSVVPPAETARLVEELGAEHCVLTSDSFNEWAPPEPEMMRMGVGQLLSCGLTPGQLRLMVYDNPRWALGLSDSRSEVTRWQKSERS